MGLYASSRTSPTTRDGIEPSAVASWGDYYDFNLRWPTHVRNVINHIPFLCAIRRLRPRSIIEVGSGTGSLSICMSYFMKQVVSLDLSDEVLERAQRNNRRMRGRVQFEAGDAFTLANFANHQFDVAVSQGFFEHFQNEDIVALIRQRLRVARRVVFSVPNLAYGKRDRGDERLMDRRAWESLLVSSGFHIERSSQYRAIANRTLLTQRRPFAPTMYLAVISSGKANG